VVSVDRSRHVPKIKYIRIQKNKNTLYTIITPRDPVSAAGNYHENTTLTLNTGGGGGGDVKSTASGIYHHSCIKIIICVRSLYREI